MKFEWNGELVARGATSQAGKVLMIVGNAADWQFSAFITDDGKVWSLPVGAKVKVTVEVEQR